MNNNVYVFNPLFKKILDSEIDSLAMKNKINIEQVYKQNLINNKIRNKMIDTKNSSLKKIYISNTEIPKSWLNRVDYCKYVKTVFKDRELQEYMRKSYPTEDIVKMNINLKNKEYINLNTETQQKKLLNFRFKKNIKIKNKIKNEEVNFLKILKYKDADELYENHKEMFFDKEVKKENEELIRYTNMINSLDLLDIEEDKNSGNDFLNREKQRQNKKRKDSDIDNALKLISLGKENKKIMLEEKDSEKNNDILFGIGNSKLSPVKSTKSKRKSLYKSSPLKRSSIFRKSLSIIKPFLELNKINEINTREEEVENKKEIKEQYRIFNFDKSNKRNDLLLSSEKNKLISFNQINNIHVDEKKILIEESKNIVKSKRDKKFDELINKMKSSNTDDNKFKLKKEENTLYYGDTILTQASNLNKIKNFSKLPILENNKVKQLIFDIKDYTSYGPYISNCMTCSQRNINFYNSSDPHTAVKILKCIRNMNIERKDLFGENI